MSTSTVTLSDLVFAYDAAMSSLAEGERNYATAATLFAKAEDGGLSLRGIATAAKAAGSSMTKDLAQDLAMFGRFLTSADTSVFPARGSLRDLVDDLGAMRRATKTGGGIGYVREALAEWSARDDSPTVADLADYLVAMRQAVKPKAVKKDKPATTDLARLRAALSTIGPVDGATLDAEAVKALSDLAKAVNVIVGAVKATRETVETNAA